MHTELAALPPIAGKGDPTPLEREDAPSIIGHYPVSAPCAAVFSHYRAVASVHGWANAGQDRGILDRYVATLQGYYLSLTVACTEPREFQSGVIILYTVSIEVLFPHNFAVTAWLFGS